MAKRSKAIAIRRQEVEVLPGRVAGRDPALERMIEQKIAEMMGNSQDGILQPFFQSKAIADAIRKLETVPQQRKWHYYFEEWGCLICENKNRRHLGLGMCAACHQRTLQRLATILRFTENERPDALAPRDLTELARAAMRRRPSETRDYITKAERRAQRKAQRQRGAATREKRAGRAETLRLAVEQGLTAREIAERYDPDFIKNPEAATQRIQAAVYRYVPQAVRARRQHERSARLAERWRKARNLHVGQHLPWRAITQRLDPEGFAKDPKAAMARIITGSRQVAMVRDLTELARSTVRRRDGCSPSKKNSAS